MKLITAVLAPERLDAVAAALAGVEVYRMTVTECRGVQRPGDAAATPDSRSLGNRSAGEADSTSAGRATDSGTSQLGTSQFGRSQFVTKSKLEIAVNENFVRPTLDAIASVADRDPQEGGAGFGKIFVTELLDVVRIRTGERGPDAI